MLVTGAGRGIGRATALALGRAGARVALVSRTQSDLDVLAREIQDAGGEALVVPGDLRQTTFPADAVAKAVRAFGGLRVLINNAGVGGGDPIADTTDEAWDRIIETNLTAVFRLTRAALPYLSVDGGHIVMVSSLAGANAISGLAAYCASKAALDHFSRCLMLEVRQRRVRVTTIAPGSVDTGFGAAAEAPREGSSWKLRPEDVADTILDVLAARDEAHVSRVEMRPARPPR